MPDSPALAARKQAWRQRIIAARDQLTPNLRAHWSHEITRRLLELPAYQQAHTVLGYLNFGSELDTRHWAQQVLARGKQLLLPRVNKASRQLELYLVRDIEQDVAPGAFGIPEPLPAHCGRFETLASLDFVLLPGVAFTRQGVRLGYGGGYYDKLLARLPRRPTLAAGAFAVQLVDDLPQETTDQPVNWLVTENETIFCGRE
ncbi:MAG: 5-formyltetrahydrofolate cyclo-ligase [Sideroxydans sp.]